MSRPPRIDYPGALHHLTARGNARADIVSDDDDRTRFVQVLDEVVGHFGWRCHAWCLMDNHYHLLVETPEANLARGMRRLNGVYTQRHNRAHARSGHVFQGRYKSILVEREAHLLELSRYIVANPVRAGLTSRARDWRWNSYRATAGLAAARSFEHLDAVLAPFGARREDAFPAYRRFVAQGRRARRPWDDLVGGGQVLGGPAFLARLDEHVSGTTPPPPGGGGYAAPPSLDQLRRRHGDRGEWMARAHREHGYTMRAIATAAGLHFSSVSKIIRAWDAGANSTFKS